MEQSMSLHDPQEQPSFFTVREVASFLRVSQASVYALVQEGRLPCHRIGNGRGTVRIRETDFETFLDSCRVESPRRKEPRRTPRPQLKHLKL